MWLQREIHLGVPFLLHFLYVVFDLFVKLYARLISVGRVVGVHHLLGAIFFGVAIVLPRSVDLLSLGDQV